MQLATFLGLKSGAGEGFISEAERPPGHEHRLGCGGRAEHQRGADHALTFKSEKSLVEKRQTPELEVNPQRIFGNRLFSM